MLGLEFHKNLPKRSDRSTIGSGRTFLVSFSWLKLKHHSYNTKHCFPVESMYSNNKDRRRFGKPRPVIVYSIPMVSHGHVTFQESYDASWTELSGFDPGRFETSDEDGSPIFLKSIKSLGSSFLCFVRPYDLGLNLDCCI